MMVANSTNLIITVKPVNQHNNVLSRRTHGNTPRQTLAGSAMSLVKEGSIEEEMGEEEDEDLVEEHVNVKAEVGGASGIELEHDDKRINNNENGYMVKHGIPLKGGIS